MARAYPVQRMIRNDRRPIYAIVTEQAGRQGYRQECQLTAYHKEVCGAYVLQIRVHAAGIERASDRSFSRNPEHVPWLPYSTNGLDFGTDCNLCERQDTARTKKIVRSNYDSPRARVDAIQDAEERRK